MVLLSVAGIAVSIYLTALHYAGVVPACPVSGAVNCEAVLSSPYAVVAGSTLPTSTLGVVWFALNLALWAVRGSGPPAWPRLAWAAAGLVAVLYLVFVEIVRVGALCLWCTAAHALVLGIVLVAVSVRR